MTATSTIPIPVSVTNPGQFFACCGLLELADRLWHGAEGWFQDNIFRLRAVTATKLTTESALFDAIVGCTVSNAMSQTQIDRLTNLSVMSKAGRERTVGLEEEKKALEKLRREEPILLGAPFHLRINWFHDENRGGNRFKTWAGQQSVIDIASSMKTALQSSDLQTRGPDNWFSYSAIDCGLPFNFDSDLGGQGSALDIGFSFDPLAGSAVTRIGSSARPFLELLAFVGLQRFRPRQIKNENRYLYCAWNHPLPPEIAAPAACGMLPLAGAPLYEFRLLYRTKYLKSFLPAIPFFGDSDE